MELLKGRPFDPTFAAEMRVLGEEMRALGESMHLLSGQDRERERAEREAERQDRSRNRESELYDQAYDAMTDSRWDRAVSGFSRVAELKGTRVEGALYWKAYSQNRLGQRAEALATIAELTKTYPTSNYLKSARALEVEVRRDVGQPVRPQDQGDEDLKLLAIQGLQQADPEQAIPMLEKLLQGSSSPRVKERALFVLAQSDSPRAREVLKNYAKASSTPELQNRAIQYLGIHGGAESRAVLGEIYAGSNDVALKRRILHAFMVSGEKERLWKAAQGEQNSELRAEAVRQLGVMGAHEELWQLYQKETAVDVKKQVIRAMFVGGNEDRMIDLAKSEKNPELRREAVRNLGLMGSKKTGDALVQIYSADRDLEIRKTVINALFLQDNASSLVALARKEDDINLKKEMVQKLALMHSKAATDFMLELIGK
jgi:HEAT repeat protein